MELNPLILIKGKTESGTFSNFTIKEKTSIMFFFGLDKYEWLEASDLSALSVRHSLRPGFVRAQRTPGARQYL